ncbi:response regulator [Rhodocaloribacter sp.]
MSGEERPRLLVVEDNPDTQKLLEYQLRTHFTLTLARGIDDALQAAAHARFDLFVLDINLGERRTGIYLLQRLYEMPAHRDTPAIALTAYALPGDRERFLKIGFRTYMSKPFLREDLLNTIRDVLASGRKT